MCVGVLECTAKRDKLIIVAVVELWKLTHAVTIDVLTVWNAVIFILVALTLVLRLFIVFLLVIAALVEQRWIRIVQNVLRVGANLPKSFDVALSCTVNSRIGVVERRVRLPLSVAGLLRAVELVLRFAIVLISPGHSFVVRVDAEASFWVLDDAL